MDKIKLGFNCNCFTNRYDEPEEWTAICRDLGIHHVMFNIDLIDPYWPWEVQKKLLDRTLEACAKNDIKINASFGGQHGHQHYLGHFDPDVRKEAENFFRRAIRQSAYLGAKSFGTCFAIQTVRTHSDPALRKEIMDSAVDSYHRLAEYAAEVGLPALAYEMTSIERETCATFAENDEVLARCSDMAVPMRICLDMGHRNREGLPEEADHLAWIRRYGKDCDVIDCQQSALESSGHWPFTEENNKKGIIDGAEVVQAIKDSGNTDVLLAFELRCAAFYPQEKSFLKNLEASVSYWRNYVKL
ncbi:MAG: TIM barrel protein [Lachnospiraceae bacterium]|nr:TIM barrel protein [Lachnospiraceae bacterium]